MISIFPIVTNTLFGLTSVDVVAARPVHAARGLAFTRLLKLQFPAAMPAIFTGFRISAGLSVIGAIVGEQFFRRPEARHRHRHGAVPPEGRFPQVYGGLLVAAVLGIAVFLVFGALRKLVVGHWHDESP